MRPLSYSQIHAIIIDLFIRDRYKLGLSKLAFARAQLADCFVDAPLARLGGFGLCDGEYMA